ncbi:hypothetical protein ASPBRDRAFT_47126 [Aspergillus brasiliensis CBS 101740]|uniref:Uncharacterized protein n=1 Tax=Aspergillus brasiliensis (strain CBS 101740 / IMI 381727 / IBT 21946) TaxID=767769 RepID=A0A1L9U920_ASPBC|nr:hypothetical protein ASPBRDRAFT_47126 [Aspergillus brasiliensis CBS 101740]
MPSTLVQAVLTATFLNVTPDNENKPLAISVDNEDQLIHSITPRNHCSAAQMAELSILRTSQSFSINKSGIDLARSRIIPTMLLNGF